MRYSELFGKTIKDAPAGEVSVNAKLLQKAGFVHKLGSGIYTLLPLGLRVTKKIADIVREEMNAIGGQELLMPALQPKDLWVESGRWETLRGAMYQLKDSSGRDFGLGFTHEEVVVGLVRDYVSSYRDLPIYLYQIQTKFRDEPRPRSGLLRGREFVMKDLYSFHRIEADLDRFYEICAKAYFKAFDRCGLEVVRTKASGGLFTKQLTDEFQVLTEGGEDEITYCQKGDFAENREITSKFAGDKCPVCGCKLEVSKSIEVGNIFKFGTVYAEKMGMTFVDQKGSRKPVYLGSYGIGITRTMAAVVEVSHDKNGINWPKSIAPYQAHLIAVSSQQSAVSSRAEEVYQKLLKAQVDVLYDDRKDISPGQKFADADLIGIPVRLVVSDKTLRRSSGRAGKGKVEWKERDKEKPEVLSVGEILKRLKKY